MSHPSSSSSLPLITRLLEELRGARWRLLERVCGLIVFVSLILPFVTVKGCDSKSVPQTYAGWETVLHAPGLLLPIYVIALGLLVYRARGSFGSALEQGARLSWKAAFMGLAAVLVWIGPVISFLFSSVTTEVGQVVAFFPWVPLWLGAMLGAAGVYWVERGKPAGSVEPLPQLEVALKHGRRAHLVVLVTLIGLTLLTPLHPDVGIHDVLEGVSWFSPVLLALILGIGLSVRGLERGECWPILPGSVLTFLLAVLTGMWTVNLLDPPELAAIPLAVVALINLLASLRAFLAWRWVKQTGALTTS